tara:strand:- start:331 stop:507 length:177 start_codon:yes stop_codon:yes gene_type:complete
MKFTRIDQNNYLGKIPDNSDLVITESFDPIGSAMWLSGFDEVGLFDGMFTDPIYGFIG